MKMTKKVLCCEANKTPDGKYLILQINLKDHPVADGFFWVDADDSINDFYYYDKESNSFEPMPPPVKSAEENKAAAKRWLAATDWTQLPDVGLANVDDFIAYRAILRDVVKNPVAGNDVIPIAPDEVWV